MNGYQDCEIEREIDIKDLCSSLLNKWKQILIGTVVICVLVLGLGLVKNKKSSTTTSTDIKSSLTDEEISNAEKAYAIYTQAIGTRDALFLEINNSALQQIDISTAVGITSTYLFDTDISDLSVYFKTINVFTDDEKDKIIEACGLNKDTINLSDLVTVDFGTNEKNVESSSKVAMTVSIYGNSEDACKTIEDIVDEHIRSKAEVINMNWQKIESLNDVDSYNLSCSQVELSKQLEEINTRITNLASPSYLNENELSYYQSLVSDEEEGTDTTVTTSSFSWKKYGVVGVAGGLFIMCFIYAMMYVMSNKVHATDDFKAYGVDSVGTLDYSKDDIGKEMWLVSSIISFMKLHELTKLYISLDYKNDKIDNTLNTFTSELKKQGIETVIGNPLTESESFNSLMSSEAVVLFETAEQSKYDSVGKIIDLAKRQNIHLVGSIITK